MASKFGTCEEVLALREDIIAQSAVSPSFRLFHADQIRKFMEFNQPVFENYVFQLDRILSTYVRQNEDGSFVILEVGPPIVYQLINPEEGEVFAQELQKLKDLKILIHY